MPASTVNLDALVPRMDFEAGEETSKPGEFEKIQIHQLVRKQLLYSVLRKPDFQRETSIWSPEKVFELIVAFVEEDLVPAVILWRSPTNYIFVIDGAHRLSSLIAWANDDYGTGAISHEFFKGDDLEVRKKSADKTRALIEERYGKYRDIEDAFSNPNATAKHKEVGAKLVSCGIRVQWLVNADAKKAENSFFKINEQGVPLDNTELTLLYSRNCANAVAARAINQFGTGHPHWRKFGEEAKTTIQEASRRIHQQLFSPTLQGNLISTPDLPIAGRSGMAGTLSLLLDTVNLTNGVEANAPIRSREAAEKLVPPDPVGSETIVFLKQTEEILSRITGKDVASLGLYPLIYFYSENGRHLPTSFLAVVELMDKLAKNNHFKEFTAIRASFEEFLASHKDFVAQVSRNSRGQIKAVHKITEFLEYVYKALRDHKTSDEIEQLLLTSKEFPYLKLPTQILTDQAKDFSTDVKNRGFIKHAMETAVRCAICDARIPNFGLSHDHKVDKKYEGIATLDNMQFTHRYCNSAKDQLVPYITGFKAAKEAPVTSL